MKKLLVMICSAVALLLNACSTDVDLYADYKQIPIIYGLLEPNADTNFIKITRAFYVQGDAHQAATNPPFFRICNSEALNISIFNAEKVCTTERKNITLLAKQPLMP